MLCLPQAPAGSRDPLSPRRAGASVPSPSPDPARMIPNPCFKAAAPSAAAQTTIPAGSSAPGEDQEWWHCMDVAGIAPEASLRIGCCRSSRCPSRCSIHLQVPTDLCPLPPRIFPALQGGIPCPGDAPPTTRRNLCQRNKLLGFFLLLASSGSQWKDPTNEASKMLLRSAPENWLRESKARGAKLGKKSQGSHQRGCGDGAGHERVWRRNTVTPWKTWKTTGITAGPQPA